jgi:hypothetical protein
MTPTMLNKNVYPHAVHVRRLSPCLNCGQRVRHGDHEIRFLFLPILEPFCTIVVALPNEGIELLDVFHAPALDEQRVDLVAKNVAVEPGTKLDQESGEAKYE